MKSNSRILIIAATPFFLDRGNHIRIMNHYQALSHHLENVRLLCYGKGRDIPSIETVRSYAPDFYRSYDAGANLHKIYLDLFLLIKAIQELLSFEPRFIYCHQYEALVAGIFLKVLSLGRVRLVFDTQGSLSQEYLSYSKKSFAHRSIGKILHFVERILLMFPDKIFTSSDNSIRYLQETFTGRAVDNAEIMYDGIPIWNTLTDSEGSRPTLSTNRVVYVGGMSPAKGVDKLLDLIPELCEKYPKYTFTFAGGGPLTEIYRERYVDLIDSGQVELIGDIRYEDTQELIQRSAIGIDPKEGTTEASGKILDYIAANLHIIAIRSDFTQKVLGKNAYLLGDLSELVDVIDKVDTSEHPKYDQSELKSWPDEILKFVKYVDEEGKGIA